MKNEYEITLHNSETEESFHITEEFITFEEAVICANHSRHKLGLCWETLSIVNTKKGGKNASSLKKTKHSE